MVKWLAAKAKYYIKFVKAPNEFGIILFATTRSKTQTICNIMDMGFLFNRAFIILNRFFLAYVINVWYWVLQAAVF